MSVNIKFRAEYFQVLATCIRGVYVSASCIYPRSILKINLPPSFNGYQFQVPIDRELRYSPSEKIPPHYWLNPPMDWGDLPLNPMSRRALLYQIFDLFHSSTCIDGLRHPHPTIWCICKLCGGSIKYLHYRECPMLAPLNPCGKLKRLNLTW